MIFAAFVFAFTIYLVAVLADQGISAQDVLRGLSKCLIKYKVIGGECPEQRGPLLIRYYIANNRFFGVYVHHLLRSDNDRHHHDHHWSFISILLKGRYVEHTPNGRKLRRVGSVAFRRAEWIHALELERPVWTLVIVGRTRRPWGFWTEKGWVSWRKYEYASREQCE